MAPKGAGGKGLATKKNIFFEALKKYPEKNVATKLKGRGWTAGQLKNTFFAASLEGFIYENPEFRWKVALNSESKNKICRGIFYL